jgi:hypothetical protein
VSIRKLHAYIGMLIAPTVLFLAMTGLLQIYNLHEAHAGYMPPALVAALSAIHKDQRFAMDRKGPPGGEHEHAAAPAPNAPPGHEAGHDGNARFSHTATALLKAFFALVALGLIFSTLAGIWMALQQSLRRRTHLVLLAIGIVVPVALAALTA